MADSETGDPKPRKEPVPWALRVTVLGVLMVAALLVMIRWLNQNSVFPPIEMDESLAPKLAAERADVRELRIPTEDGLELYGWLLGPDQAPRKIIQFGGNAEYVGPGVDLYADTAKQISTQFLLFDYRGFANSPGRPSEPGLYRDARGVYRYAVDELGWKPEQIVLWGRSLGCAPAVKLAHELHGDESTPPAALILESPFLSIKKMAVETMGWLVRPDWLVYSLFDNERRVPELKCPVFVMHGRDDTIIPFEHGEQLFQKIDAPKEFMELEGVDHNDTWNDAERAGRIRARINEFLEAHT